MPLKEIHKKIEKKILRRNFGQKWAKRPAYINAVERNSQKNRKKILRRNFGQKWAKWPAYINAVERNSQKNRKTSLK